MLIKRLIDFAGVKRGDVVGLWSCNSLSWVVVQYACARVGAILCTLNPFYKLPELAYALQKARVSVLLMPGKESDQRSINNFYEVIQDKTLTEVTQITLNC